MKNLHLNDPKHRTKPLKPHSVPLLNNRLIISLDKKILTYAALLKQALK